MSRATLACRVLTLLCTTTAAFPLSAAASSPVSAAAATASSPLWLRADAPVDDRVAALLAEMTNAEKQAQTIHLTGGVLADIVKAYGAVGLGAFPNPGGSPAALATRNALQSAIMDGSRLHIPVSFHQETLHGGCEGCVIFPMPAGQGSTWDTVLVGDVARVIATEAYAAGLDRGFSPELNVPGDARFGRTEENFSEVRLTRGREVACKRILVPGLRWDASSGSPPHPPRTPRWSPPWASRRW